MAFGQILEIWTNKFLNQCAANILKHSGSGVELGCSGKSLEGGAGVGMGMGGFDESECSAFEPGCYGFEL